jgi:hypothetical protein
VDRISGFGENGLNKIAKFKCLESGHYFQALPINILFHTVLLPVLVVHCSGFLDIFRLSARDSRYADLLTSVPNFTDRCLLRIFGRFWQFCDTDPILTSAQLRSSSPVCYLSYLGKLIDPIHRLPHPSIPVTNLPYYPIKKFFGMPIFLSFLANLTWRQPLATHIPWMTASLLLLSNVNKILIFFSSPFRHVQIPSPSLHR